MPVLGITGGIATGKSTLARGVAKALRGTLFDADAAARESLSEEPGVVFTVREAFGSEILGADGGIDRARLREIVFRDDQERRKLEAILHPLIRSRWIARAEEVRREGGWMVVDIPLLFETGAESAFDWIAVVACSAATQRSRIVLNRGLSAEMADRMIAAQQSLALKVARADHVVWNDSPLARLEEQTKIFAAYLYERYPERGHRHPSDNAHYG